MNDYFFVYVTKYALTAGIQRVAVSNASEDGCVRDFAQYTSYYWKPHWHNTYPEALARAEVMRTKKIAGLKKQVAKIEAMVFTESKEADHG